MRWLSILRENVSFHKTNSFVELNCSLLGQDVSLVEKKCVLSEYVLGRV